MEYSIISGIRNEMPHFREVYRRVVSQTLLPRKWVIVDDGSTDDTSDFLRSIPERWIEVIEQPSSSELSYSRHYAQLDLAWKHTDTELVMVLDGDTLLDRNYAEIGAKYMEENPEVWMASGKLYYQGKRLKILRNHVWGTGLFIRRELLKEIGIPHLSVGDTALRLYTLARGKKIGTFEARMESVRPMTKRYPRRVYEEIGCSLRKMGVPPLFVLLNSFKRMALERRIDPLWSGIYSRKCKEEEAYAPIIRRALLRKPWLFF